VVTTPPATIVRPLPPPALLAAGEVNFERGESAREAVEAVEDNLEVRMKAEGL